MQIGRCVVHSQMGVLEISQKNTLTNRWWKNLFFRLCQMRSVTRIREILPLPAPADYTSRQVTTPNSKQAATTHCAFQQRAPARTQKKPRQTWFESQIKPPLADSSFTTLRFFLYGHIALTKNINVIGISNMLCWKISHFYFLHGILSLNFNIIYA